MSDKRPNIFFRLWYWYFRRWGRDFRYWVKRQLQKTFRGYSDQEVWAFNSCLVEYALPRLYALKKMHHGFLDYQDDLSEEENDKHTEKIWDAMIRGFELFQKCDKGLGLLTQSEMKEFNRGLSLFSKHFMSLWD